MSIMRETGFFTLFSLFFTSYLSALLLVRMLVDVRNRRSSTPVKVPVKYNAYIYGYNPLDGMNYKVVLAPDKVTADQYVCDWCYQHDFPVYSFRFIETVDYEVVGYQDDDYFRNLLFPDVSQYGSH